MFRFVTRPSETLPDAGRFLAALNAQVDFFDPARPVYAARAPGRLDLMGGIADYSGALVLELPLACAAWAAVQWSAEPAAVIRTTSAEVHGPAEVSMALDELLDRDYAAVRGRLSRDPAAHWAAYGLGAVTILHGELGFRVPRGLRVLVVSEVPAGKGVSSSAAMEVAVMHALAGLLGQELPGRDLALLCQKVENLIVGAPCGVMDQMTAACGAAGSLVALLCQPAELQAPVHLPDGLEVWGLDSGIRHAVSGADYGSVRVGAFMGYRIVAGLAGLPVAALGAGRVAVSDDRWRGALANLTPSEWETHFRDAVPEALTGADFVARYGGFTDTVTHIDPARRYAVRQPAAHPIYEHWRVSLFRSLLVKADAAETEGPQLGELMYQSHASYSACGLGSDGTDRLVELVRAAGPAAGLYGAKITGGGSGGTVAVLARRGARPAVAAVAEQYTRETGRPAAILGGSSPGALAGGVQQLAA